MLATIVCLVFIYFLFKDLFQKTSTYPPGTSLIFNVALLFCPRAYPVIGNLFSVWYNLRKYRYQHTLWQVWSKKYGVLLGLKLGAINMVVVSGKAMIKEVSSKEVFSGRPDGIFYTIRSFGKKLGLVFSDGPAWSKTNRIVLKYLKSFGYGTRHMEIMIVEECKEFINCRMADSLKPIQANGLFDVAVVNILWRIVAGKRYDLNDEKLKHLCYMITQSFKLVDMSGGLLNFMPSLRHVVPGLIGYTQLKKLNDEIHGFLKETIKQHKESIDVKNARDVLDAFLIEMIEHKKSKFSDEELQVVCLDLLEAGVETVSRTVDFMFLHIVRNNQVQTKLHREIDEFIGQGRTPLLSDRNRMVYTEAVLLESLRISTVAAVGIPHMALEDAQLGPYTIPKGTYILLALHDLHNCSHWTDPNEFRPERFLTKEGNLMQDEWLMPFGYGRRKCIGEGLARSELFLFLTHILQKFNLVIPSGDPTPSVEPVNGVTLSPKPFRVIFQPRN